MDHLQYLAEMGLCLLVTLPLELLGAHVWRQPKRLVATVGIVAIVFALFDTLSISQHLWTYARRYTTGIDIGGILPIEELTFFIVIPICVLLTYETVRNRRLLRHRLERLLTRRRS